MNYNIAVLMTVHNRKVKTLSSLDALYRSFYNLQNTSKAYSLSIFLTDDGSTDGTSEEIIKEFPDVHVLRSKGDLFWNRGMINSWKEAAKNDFDFYIWLNDDTMLNENSLNQIFSDYYECKKENESILVGTTQSEKGNTTYGGRINSGLLNPTGFPQKCVKINGNFVLVPQKIFKEIGFLDERFHHGLGDHDYGLRALKKGFSLYTTSSYVGICEAHDTLSYCFRPNTSLVKRLKHLYSPLGNNPYEYFYFAYRHYGAFVAFKHYLSIHLRVLVPGLWK